MPFDALLQYSRRASERLMGRDASSDDVALGFALHGGAAHVYNELTFRHFLDLERRRAARSQRPFILVLVSGKASTSRHQMVTPALATRIFSVLSQSVREVDFVGWYREGRIAGAVLAQGSVPITRSVLDVISNRITASLHEELSRSAFDRVKVRVLQVRRGAAC